MKVALLAPGSSVHAVRWANGLAGLGCEIDFISLHPRDPGLQSDVRFHLLPFGAPLGYIAAAVRLKMLLREIAPDLLNAHYATGYGLLARLSGFSPLMLSVWGSDVYVFPEKSALRRIMLRSNLKAATSIGSTSRSMARKTAETYVHKSVFITPFGVDESIFYPRASSEKKRERTVIIGTVKSLRDVYGVDILIKAFALVRKRLEGQINVELEITGEGPESATLKKLVEQLNISDCVRFHGAVPHGAVPEMLSRLDIYVALSRSESFGVAVLEAKACGVPVVVSDADGPAEVTIDGGTGIIVPKENVALAAEAIEKLVRDPVLRTEIGKRGREHVLQSYTWSGSLETMMNAYRKTLDLC